MSGPSAPDALDLAALLCSRVCHDLISPVGAIVNGLEVLEEEKDEQTRVFAMDLIKRSATTASARLQFCRLAFGAAGSAGAQIDLGDAEKMARGFIADEKTSLTWNPPRAFCPKNRVKMLLNMIILAGQAIPRGGAITVDPVGDGETMSFRVTSRGLNARAPAHLVTILNGDDTGQPIDAHAIQPYYTRLLAQNCGLVVTMVLEDDAVVVAAAQAE